ncbi:DUF4439 domain-containing protein [Corynebacterium guangdongense]|uniref:DUF4439 domain-containing protein n=1 Tax=Corynebacterium guangdongense TaxID=1783348 RepID=A0ABU1ZXB4_9CORY|nr:DUF4439 domain-containing protein [Corynebacterium guangdongense]MDR7329565.1 hypothetical protein [Corynebacterium guangdongense]WJZ18130.1 hypothetical protein CGUA_07840 [Corynebacterium guangdongense]
MNRGLRLLAAAALASTLAGCSVVDALGPSANSQVLTLGQLAESDAEAWSGEAADLRAHHARDLFAEVERLCGTDEEGRIPESCDYERANPEVTAHEDAAGSLAEYVDLIPAAPAESRELLTAQAVDLAALADQPPAAPELSPADAELARDLLRREFAAVYALDLAQAYTDPADTAALDTLIDAHDTRVRLLEDALGPTGDVPVAEAGYAVPETEAPSDPAGARSFAVDVEHSLVQSWAQAAAQVDGASLGWFLALAGDAARALEDSALAR